MGSYGQGEPIHIEFQAKQNSYSLFLINGDTVKQLLARSRYLLYKSRQNGPTTKKKERSYYLNVS
jgi:hypothetical protein